MVIRRTGSSLLVVGEGDGGGGLLVAPVEERAAHARCVVECLRREGAGTGGVLRGLGSDDRSWLNISRGLVMVDLFIGFVFNCLQFDCRQI